MPDPAEIIILPTKAKKKPKGSHASGLVRRSFRYRDAYGISQSKEVYGKTATEAEQKKREFLAAVAASLRVDQQAMTVAAWADEWLEVYKKPHVSEKTLGSYQTDVNLIKESIGHLPMKAVLPMHLQGIINKRKDLSSSAIKKTSMTISALFTAAVQNRILQASPAVGLTIPGGTYEGHRYLEDEEISAIVGAASALDADTRQPHRFALAVMLMIFAGLRVGECAAFDVDRDVDFDAKEIRVTEALTWPVNQSRRKGPKTDAGVRAIPIFQPLLPFLEAAKGNGLALSGVNNPGKIISKSAYRHAIASFVGLCGVQFTAHDCRYTFATMLYDAGVDVKTAQLWLGHQDPMVTIKIYTQLSKRRKQASSTSAEEFMKQYLLV